MREESIQATEEKTGIDLTQDLEAVMGHEEVEIDDELADEDGFFVGEGGLDARDVYKVDGVADWWEFKVIPYDLNDNGVTTIENDFYLRDIKPEPFYGASIKHLEKQYAGYKKVSAFQKSSHTYTEFAEANQPVHGSTEGGKGLALYTHPMLYTTAQMSSILNINISFGCPANCSFCKESILARNFTQMNIKECSGIVNVKVHDPDTKEFKGEFDVAGKARVKFYDSENETVVLGPLQVALANNFPIAKQSLAKLIDKDLFRVLAD